MWWDLLCIKLITGLTQDFAMTDEFKMNSGLGAVGVLGKTNAMAHAC